MTRGAQNVIQAFEQLAPTERDEVVRELLRRTATSAHESATDEELLQAADAVFLELDHREG